MLTTATQQEFLLVASGVKPVARILTKHLEQIQQRVQSLQLAIEFSDYKLQLEQDTQLGYSNKGARSKHGDTYICYISKDELLATQAKQAEAQDDHEKLGELLGYPACCRDFFQRNTQTQQRQNNDYILPMLKEMKYENIQTMPWQNNVFARYGGFTLLSHFPHSLSCQASKELADSYAKVLEKQESFMQIKKMLLHTVIYTETQGVFFLVNAKLEKEKLFFDHVMSTVNNALFDQLNATKSCTVQEHTINGTIQAYVVMFR